MRARTCIMYAYAYIFTCSVGTYAHMCKQKLRKSVDKMRILKNLQKYAFLCLTEFSHNVNISKRAKILVGYLCENITRN